MVARGLSVLVVSLVPALAAAQQQQPPPPTPMAEALKKAVADLAEMQKEMVKLGYKGETADAENIIRKLSEWSKPCRQSGSSTPWPGDEAYAKGLTGWSELGTKISGCYAEAAKAYEEELKTAEQRLADAKTNVEKAKAQMAKDAALKSRDEAQLIAGWLASFKEVASAVRHLNRRRKFCKMGPVTCTWAGSIGGYLHGRYLHLNRDHPSTAGLGAHDEDRKLPGWTVEGSGAAGNNLSGGSPEGCIDGLLGSAYHRDPVFNPGCGKIVLGGGFGGWAITSGGGIPQPTDSKVFSFPGDGDTEISTLFGGEAPNPLPDGMTSSGTFVVCEFRGSAPRKPETKLYEATSELVKGAEVEIILLQKHNPVEFVAKKQLKGGTTYLVEIVGNNGITHRFSFRTR